MVIKDGKITHGDFLSPLQSFRFESDILNNITVAILATVLSYQSTVLVSDLIMGCKPRGRVSVPDIHTVLLGEEFSFVSTVAAISRNDKIDRFRFRNLHVLPPDSPIARVDRHIRKRAVIKLLFLLMVAPLSNLIAIILAVERNKTVSFAEAKFGGLALGVNRDLSRVQNYSRPDGCLVAKDSFPSNIDPLVQFSICNSFRMPPKVNQSQPYSIFSLQVEPQGEILIALQVPNPINSQVVFNGAVNADAIFKKTVEVFRIKPALEVESAKKLLRRASLIAHASQTCADVQNPPRFKVEGGEEELKVSVFVDCVHMSREKMEEIMFMLIDHVTLVSTKELKLASISKHEAGSTVSSISASFRDFDSNGFISRRTGVISVGGFFIVALSALLLRVIVQMFTNNDINKNIDVVMKNSVPEACAGSMLLSDAVLTYGKGIITGIKQMHGKLREQDEFESSLRDQT